jgi:hypothetical protein
LVRTQELPSPRNHGAGPERVPLYGHQFGVIHDRIVGSTAPDETFYSKISNNSKVEYICVALRMRPHAFHLDLPFPVEDWAASEDVSMNNCGLYLAELRRQFFGALLEEHPEFERTPVWLKYGEAEYWGQEFNHLVTKRRTGNLILDGRVKH